MNFSSLKVGFLLGKRQIQRANIWTTVLVIFIMTLTFLNLVVVSGILVGLIEGSVKANRVYFTSDLLISAPKTENSITNTNTILDVLPTIDFVESYSARYIRGAIIEANYQSRRDFQQEADTAGTSLVGINPDNEHATTFIRDLLEEGEFLQAGETGYIVLGKNLLERYLEGFGNIDFSGLSEVYPGSRVKVSVGESSREFIVKGIVGGKVDSVTLRAFITEEDYRLFPETPGEGAQEISIRIDPLVDANTAKQVLVQSELDSGAVIETWEEGQGQFLADIKNTFSLLGSVIGGIALMVASITIFIIIFINAITRRKFIGILKGIGISGFAIEFSYLIQAFFYALIGSTIGLILTYGVLIPYFLNNPIDFPFSDGILVAPIDQTIFRFMILMITTLVAGFLPARYIINKNTLDSILGR